MWGYLEGKGLPQQARTGPRVSRQVTAPDFLEVRYYEGGRSSALRTGRHFQSMSRTQGTWFRRQLQKKSSVPPPGIDPETVRLVAQCLNHYATPGPIWKERNAKFRINQVLLKLSRLVKYLQCKTPLLFHAPLFPGSQCASTRLSTARRPCSHAALTRRCTPPWAARNLVPM